jgi:hypothetical protein
MVVLVVVNGTDAIGVAPSPAGLVPSNTSYPVIDAEPERSGWSHVRSTESVWGVAASPMGGPGTVGVSTGTVEVACGVTGAEALDAAPFPTTFAATTVKV